MNDSPTIGQIAGSVSHRVWVSASIVSIALLAIVLSQVEFGLIREALSEVVWPLFGVALMLLMSEGFATAKRMQVFTPGPPSYAACLRISAWFVIYLIVLPARLGEVVAVVLLRVYAAQASGPALASLLTQRLFDLLVLIAVFLLAAMLVSGLPLGFIAVAAALILFAVLGALVVWLEDLLARAALVVGILRAKWRWAVLKKIQRLLIQARSWRRHHGTALVMRRALWITFAKWFANLGGLSTMFIALGFPVDVLQAVLLAAAFNFLAVVPLQSVGGIGVSEVGLAGLLMVFGASVEYAASMTIVVRVILLSTPVLYWVLVMAVTSGADFSSVRRSG